jgi:hypothetical protein
MLKGLAIAVAEGKRKQPGGSGSTLTPWCYAAIHAGMFKITRKGGQGGQQGSGCVG